MLCIITMRRSCESGQEVHVSWVKVVSGISTEYKNRNRIVSEIRINPNIDVKSLSDSFLQQIIVFLDAYKLPWVTIIVCDHI